MKGQGYWGFIYSQGGVIGTKMGSTAYVHRKAVASFQFGVSDPESVSWLTDLYKFLRPHYSESEQNYADLDERDWKTLYYASNLERLIQIKRKYDPGNLFRYPFSIPLNTSGV
ncbi:hypothetical protein K7432_017981 [Basidiobolus ranarum]|uniref:Berberine/berberine-like domain-containing protein n=1 Tax=Basidiobolus ranarum TaxID=34480 RepID=A0ABR2WCP4_9FUNG